MARILFRTKAQYRVHKSPSLFPILSQSTTCPPFCLISILILSFHLFLGLTISFLLTVFPDNNLYVSFSSFHTCNMTANLILQLSTWIIPGELWKPCSSSLRSNLQTPLISTLLGTNILAWPHWHVSACVLSLTWQTTAFHPFRKPANL